MLPGSQRQRLLQLLGNETDMCFRQRMLRCFEYLELTPEDRLLDCGSGRGFVANMAREISGCSVVALEFERELLPILKAHNQSDAVTPVNADLTKIPLADGQFKKAVFTETRRGMTGYA